jgi:hypothetical protein
MWIRMLEDLDIRATGKRKNVLLRRESLLLYSDWEAMLVIVQWINLVIRPHRNQ